MEHSSLNSELITHEHGHILEEPPLSEEIVTLESVSDPSNEELVLQAVPHTENEQLSLGASSSSNDVFITNQNVSLSDFTGRKTLNPDELAEAECLIDENTSETINNAEIINLLISQRKQQQVNLESVSPPLSYTCSTADANIVETPAEEIDHKKTDIEKKLKVPVSHVSVATSTEDEPIRPTYYAIEGTAIPEQLHSAGFEVTTFVTEDGQTGQILIPGSSSFTTEIPEKSTEDVGLNDNVSTVTTLTPEGQTLTGDGMEQIAGLEKLEHAIQIQQNNDANTQIQFLIKEEESISKTNFSSPPLVKKTYQCDEEGCTKQFSNPTRLKAHKKIHSGIGFVCSHESCGKAFITHSDLQKHLKTHIGQKDFVCEVEGCGKEYTTIHHLKVHKRQHSGERPFVCEWEGCGKMFTTGYGLKSHFRTHTNERPYKCKEENCSKAFKTSGDLQKHIRTHTGERPFVCPYQGCNRSFTTSNIRKVHVRTHTGEKPYKCEIETCGRMFASATNYKNHARIHTGERPYVCEVPGCMRRFTEYSSLYKHNIVHTHTKPYICTICSKSYRQTSTLAMHKRTVHGTDDLTESEKTFRKITPTVKKPKISQRHRIPSNQHNGNYIQGMQLVINSSVTNGIDTSYSTDMTATQQIESSDLAGAIAIPIQVTMNRDGTIAGAQGLNLTDGSGRMIPVNLSVNIPITSFDQYSDNIENTRTEKTIIRYPDNIIENTGTEKTTIRYPDNIASTGTEKTIIRGDGLIEVLSNNGINNMTNVTIRDIKDISDTSRVTMINGVQPQANMDDSFDMDNDERDVTDKYLTSHYSKERKDTNVR